MAGLPILALPGQSSDEGLRHHQGAAVGATRIGRVRSSIRLRHREKRPVAASVIAAVEPWCRATLSGALIAALAGCAVPTAPGPAAGQTISSSAGADDEIDDVVFAPYAAASAAGRRVLRFDPAASSVRAYVFRAGRAARLGHNHVLSAVDFSGACLLADGDLSGVRCDVVLRLDRLEIDRTELRAGLGPAFAATLSPEAIAATREHMLGEDNLQAARFPTLRLRTLALVGELPKPMAQIEVTLHGQRQTQWLALDVRGLPQRLQVRGAFVLRQSDFGVRPYAVGNGLIAVQDEIAVEFELVGD